MVWMQGMHQISYTQSMVAKRGNWTSFHSKKRFKTKNADAQVWGDARGDQKQETFFGPNYAEQSNLLL